MPTMDYSKEITDLKRRVDLAETKLTQQAGQFEFISGQLRDVQLYLHARFADMETGFSELRMGFAETSNRLGALDDKVDALPRVLAEMIGRRD